MTTLLRLFRANMIIPVILLAACGKKAPDGPSSPTLERAALMQLAFPGWAAKGTGHKQKLHIPASDSGAADVKGKPVETVVDEFVDPAFVVRLSDDDATLLFRADRFGDSEQAEPCDTCATDYGAVQFHRYDGNWRIANRQDTFRGAYAMVESDTPEIIKLAQHAFALKLTVNEGHFGEEVNTVELYELTPSGPRDLRTQLMTTSADNDGEVENSCADALAMLKKKQPLPNIDHACWHVDSKWLLDATGESPGDLTLQFSGLYRLQDGSKKFQYHRVDSKQVWRYQNGKYRLVSGDAPFDQLPG